MLAVARNRRGTAPLLFTALGSQFGGARALETDWSFTFTDL